ncbi:MAG: LLM class flavin-dependent oxidoreductase [Actinomycetota bacterium]|nr:LLM class flavin-dependent oxidoreductase [Actinomycetota bacterium]MDA8317458.1 LLM class flavin-dependent oxidoreductase [Actinomycetota bacterium]
MDPKPPQEPHPPLLFGGAADASLRRAGRMADGWISSSRADLADLARPIGVVRAAAAEEGRDPSSLRFVCRAVGRSDRPRVRRSPGPSRRSAKTSERSPAAA